jgi:hypothetical protein
MRCLMGEVWRGATSVSIRKEADSRPSEEMTVNASYYATEGKLHTKSRDDRCLLTVLALEAIRNPRAVLANGRHVADASEHIA